MKNTTKWKKRAARGLTLAAMTALFTAFAVMTTITARADIISEAAASNTTSSASSGSLSDSLGGNVKWSYDPSTHIMAVSGTGVMGVEDPFVDALRAAYSDEVKKVVVEEGVTELNSRLFEGYTELEEVVLPESLETIGDYVFSECTALKSIHFEEGLKTLGTNAFNECGLTEITLPDSLTNLSENVFMQCQSLERVVLGSEIQKIPSCAFSNCSKLREIVIPDSVVEIGPAAFDGCHELKTLKLGKNVKYIGSAAFSGCIKLKTVTLPESLETMEQGVFSKCTSLETVIVNGNIPAELLDHYYYLDESGNQIKAYLVFDNIEYYTDITFLETAFVSKRIKGIIVPNGTLTRYQNEWSDWKNYIKEVVYEDDDDDDDDDDDSYYVPTVPNPIKFVSVPDKPTVGTWNLLADGNWTCHDQNGKIYRNAWVLLYNPYASDYQKNYDWFYFGENTYLSTGWQWLDRNGDGVFECYYFNPISDGTKGRLYSNTTTPDGYQVNENGQWIVNGAVQTKR